MIYQMMDKIIEIKNIKARPNFYASCFDILKEAAYNAGYNLLIHGSLNRDLDLVAIPWRDDPITELEFIKKLDLILNGEDKENKEDYLFSVLPGGRNSYVINLYRLDKETKQDFQYYLDISITPLITNYDKNN